MNFLNILFQVLPSLRGDKTKIKQRLMDTGDVDDFFNKLDTYKFLNKKIDCPESLYHYTSFRGLKGILESKKFFATHYENLNDGTELRYVLSILESITKELISVEAKRAFANACETLSMLTKKTYGAYVFSACDGSDYLPCWRCYAEDAGGFALGIDFSKIDLKHSSEYQINRGRVMYMEAEYWPLIKNDVHKLNDVAITREHVIRLAACILSMAPFIKHPGFMEEKEYRLLIRDNNPEEVPGGKIPQELLFKHERLNQVRFCNPIKSAIIEFLPEAINEIWIGPRCDLERGEFEIKRLLENNGYSIDKIKIKKSEIPFVGLA